MLRGVDAGEIAARGKCTSFVFIELLRIEQILRIATGSDKDGLSYLLLLVL